MPIVRRRLRRMAKILVHMEDVQTVLIRFAHDFIGLGFDVLDDEYPDRGLRLGVANTVELTITVEVAKELLQRLIDEVEFSV